MSTRMWVPKPRAWAPLSLTTWPTDDPSRPCTATRGRADMLIDWGWTPDPPKRKRQAPGAQLSMAALPGSSRSRPETVDLKTGDSPCPAFRAAGD